VVAIAAGENHSCALKNDGTVVQWGDPSMEQVPAGLTNVVAIAAGGFHTLALKIDGTVVAWGSDYYLQCSPSKSLSNIVAIAAGEYHSIALQSNGVMVTFGNDGSGQCSPPITTNIACIGAGSYHSLAVTRNGTVFAWGDNSFGQTNALNVPDAVSVTGSYYGSFALKSDGTISTWGNAGNMPTFGNVVAVAAGRVHALALVGARSAALSIKLLSGNASVDWSDTSFQLQTTTNLLDALSWHTVSTTTNSFATNPVDQLRFFRLIKN
jgi:alpha-tubulin suppressor-like RCC1 family protein